MLPSSNSDADPPPHKKLHQSRPEASPEAHFIRGPGFVAINAHRLVHHEQRARSPARDAGTGNPRPDLHHKAEVGDGASALLRHADAAFEETPMTVAESSSATPLPRNMNRGRSPPRSLIPHPQVGSASKLPKRPRDPSASQDASVQEELKKRLDKAFEEGRRIGYNDGLQEGRNERDEERYKEGHKDGLQKGRNERDDKRYNEGFEAGYDKGHKQGGHDQATSQGLRYISNAGKSRVQPSKGHKAGGSDKVEKQRSPSTSGVQLIKGPPPLVNLRVMLEGCGTATATCPFRVQSGSDDTMTALAMAKHLQDVHSDMIGVANDQEKDHLTSTEPQELPRTEYIASQMLIAMIKFPATFEKSSQGFAYNDKLPKHCPCQPCMKGGTAKSGKGFQWPSDIKRHVQTHFVEKPHCPYCQKPLSRFDKIPSHVRSIHPEMALPS